MRLTRRTWVAVITFTAITVLLLRFWTSQTSRRTSPDGPEAAVEYSPPKTAPATQPPGNQGQNRFDSGVEQFTRNTRAEESLKLFAELRSALAQMPREEAVSA